MFRKVVCRLVFCLAVLVAGTACVSISDGSYEAADLSATDVTTLTAAMVDAVSLAFAPAKVVFAMQPAGPVGRGVARQLRALGYGVTPHPGQETLSLRYTISHHASRVIYLGVSVVPGWRVDRLFTADIDDQLQPANMATFRDDEQRMARLSLPTLSVSNPAGRISLPRQPASHLPTTGTTPPDQEGYPDRHPATANTSLPDKGGQGGYPDGHPAPCGQVALAAGSLRVSITKMLRQCGYSLGDWSLGESGYIDDWVIQQPYTVTVAGGIEGVLKLLASHYALSGEIRPLSQTVDFSYREETL